MRFSRVAASARCVASAVFLLGVATRAAACPANSYACTPGSFECSASGCVTCSAPGDPLATSPENSTSAAACVCSAGYYSMASYYAAYLPGVVFGHACVACDQGNGGTSPAGSTDSSACACAAGYYPASQYGCQPCSSSVDTTPLSPAGSASGASCTCPASMYNLWFYYEDPASPTFQPGGPALACVHCGYNGVAFGTSPAGSTSGTQCACPANYFSSSPLGCPPCDAGLVSPAGSQGPASCVCPPNTCLNASAAGSGNPCTTVGCPSPSVRPPLPSPSVRPPRPTATPTQSTTAGIIAAGVLSGVAGLAITGALWLRSSR